MWVYVDFRAGPDPTERQFFASAGIRTSVPRSSLCIIDSVLTGQVVLWKVTNYLNVWANIRVLYTSFFLKSWFRASWFNVNKKVQLYATVCRHLFTAKSLYMFRASQHPSSGALKTVTATSGKGHNTGRATSFQRGLIRPRWKEVAVPVLWPIPEVAVTVFSAPDNGCCDARNM